MLRVGEYQTLKIIREKPQGFYLACEDGDEVLYPQKYITPEMEIGGEVEVIVYRDTEDLEVATNEQAIITINQFALLHVNDVNDVGAFCDWGVNKELFIPFKNQGYRMEREMYCVVFMYLDEDSDRLVGTTKLKKHLKHVADEGLKMGQSVNALIYDKTELGYKAVINNTYAGLIYANEIGKELDYGQRLKVFVKPIRPDGKIDLSLSPIGHANIEPFAQSLLDKLAKRDGFLGFTDKSDPELIRKEFGVSKKVFKKALGSLYKARLVELKDNGIFLIQ